MPADSLTFYDEAVRRRIALERYSTAQARDALKLLKEVEADLLAKIAQLQAAGRSVLTIRQQQNLLASVKDVSAEIYERLQTSLRKGMTKLAGSEFDKAQTAMSAAAESVGLTATTQTLTGTAAFEIAASKPMQGALLKDWLADLEPRHRDRIERALRISFAEGENLSSAARRLREAGLQNGRGLEALVRTSNAHIAAQVDQAVTDANADIIEGVEWVAVLDARTTDICRSRDGKVYPIDSGPRPPAHIGCRSTTRKILKGMEPLPRETYAQWLKRQPAATQDDILGPARGKLFRSGKLTVDRFVDMKGKTLTLAELGVGRASSAPSIEKILGLPDLTGASKKVEVWDAIRAAKRTVAPEARGDLLDYVGRALQADKIPGDQISWARQDFVLQAASWDVAVPPSLRRVQAMPKEWGATLKKSLAGAVEKVGANSAAGRAAINDIRDFVMEDNPTFRVEQIEKATADIVNRTVSRLTKRGAEIPFEHALPINFWTRGASSTIQSQLRTRGLSPIGTRYSDRLKKALSVWSKDYADDAVTYRGLPPFDRVLQQLEGWQPGRTVTLNAYEATTKSRERIGFFAVEQTTFNSYVEIQYVGKKAARSLDAISEFSGENELLLSPGTRLRVVSRENTNDGAFDVLRIVVEVLDAP